MHFRLMCSGKKNANFFYTHTTLSHIAQNIAEKCQEYFLYFIAIEILSQYFWEQINI